MKDNITIHDYSISKKQRQEANKHNSFLLWFTGLSGSGKSTIANLVEIELFKRGIKTYTLDGDNIRSGISKDLDFSPEDRTENIRRIAEISNLMIDAGLVVLAAFISPYIKDRDNVRSIVSSDNFIEIYINTSLKECEKRDPKNLYKKARSGIIKNMTGISAPYEPPTNPDIEIFTEEENIEAATLKILTFIDSKMKLSLS